MTPPHDSDEIEPSLLVESAEDLYEDAPCGYFSLRRDGTIVRANRTLVAWSGYSHDELLGRRVQDILTIGSRIFWETHLAPLLHMQGFLREVSVDIACKSGRALPAMLHAVDRQNQHGEPVLTRITVFDATERRSFERELVIARRRAEQAAQAKAEFLSTVSHEIRTPLNAIIGIAHLFGNTNPTAQQQKYLRILRSSSEGLLALVNDILDFTKIEAGKSALDEEPVEVRELVATVAQNLQLKADEKKIGFHVVVDESIPGRLCADRVKLQQVLTNLIGNAIKFTAVGHVAIEARVVQDEGDRVSIRFSVSDTGIGIAEDQQARIFESFAQANREVGIKYGGTGLGLAISKKIVELHGAELNLRSTPGEGSTFVFVLSLRRAEADVAAPATPNDGRYAAVRGMRVLVADDNEVNVFVLGGFLRRWGVVFDVVTNGEEAVERAANETYDAILMDLRMPVLDGYEAARRIRALPGERFPKLPILAVSASTRIGQSDRLSEVGFSDFVGKPIDPDVLLGKLAAQRG